MRLRTIFVSTCMLALSSVTYAQTAATSPGGSNLLATSGTRGPVEITSETLEVRQAEQIAIFAGNVLAIQGDLKLKADTMTVHYRKNAEGSGDQQSVSKIVVDGNVFLANPNETARGDKGIYDVDANEIRLIGNVVLTRAENVLKGEAMVYNMNTGKSVLTAAGKTIDGKPPRVRALFVPNKKGE